MKNWSIFNLKIFLPTLTFQKKCNRVLIALLTLFYLFNMEIVLKKFLNLINLVKV